MFTKKSEPKVSIKAPWSNRSKILAGVFVAGCVGSAASVWHDMKCADDDLIPDAAIDGMLAEDAGAAIAAEAL